MEIANLKVEFLNGTIITYSQPIEKGIEHPILGEGIPNDFFGQYSILIKSHPELNEYSKKATIEMRVSEK